jgi:hypothetical protein
MGPSDIATKAAVITMHQEESKVLLQYMETQKNHEEK